MTILNVRNTLYSRLNNLKLTFPHCYFCKKNPPSCGHLRGKFCAIYWRSLRRNWHFFHLGIISCVVHGIFIPYTFDKECLIVSAKYAVELPVLGSCSDNLMEEMQSCWG